MSCMRQFSSPTLPTIPFPPHPFHTHPPPSQGQQPITSRQGPSPTLINSNRGIREYLPDSLSLFLQSLSSRTTPARGHQHIHCDHVCQSCEDHNPLHCIFLQGPIPWLQQPVVLWLRWPGWRQTEPCCTKLLWWGGQQWCCSGSRGF